MLYNLSIENIALIEKADVNFGEGFNVLTGETGAGKSILIGSLNMLLGERIGRDMIRNGEKYAYVEGLFYIDDRAANALADFDVAPEEDGSLIVSRKLSTDGKNICKAGGKTVPVSVLREIGRVLVNIHGQHDNQALLDHTTHIAFLDAFAKEDKEIFFQYSELYSALKKKEQILAEISTNETEKNRKADILRFEINEIQCAALYPGEEEELKQQRTLARNKESFIENCARSLDLLYENSEGGCAYNLLNECRTYVESAAEADTELEESAEKLAEICYSIEDITSVLRDRLEHVSDQSFPLEEIEERLDIIYRLKRKYGNSEEEILDYCEKAISELDVLDTSDEHKAELENEINKLRAETTHLAEKIHKLREKKALEVEKYIMAELAELQMEGALFSVSFEECDLCKNGLDKVEFLFSANKGEPLKSLSKIVSGGELSRIMLAMKRVLAEGDVAGTLIFDEIDTGISGRAAGKVGSKLYEISDKKQVLCVTHLPQIAALSDFHFKISKNEEKDKTVTQISLLCEDEKQAEIALMIGGDVVTDITLAQAADMIKKGKR